MTIQIGLQVQVDIHPHFYLAVGVMVGIFRKVIKAFMLS